MKIMFVWPNKDSFGLCKPIGISLLSAIAKERGWETNLFDTTEIDFGFVNSNKAGESAKMFKPIDFTPYNVDKKKIDLKDMFIKSFDTFKPDYLAFTVLSDEYKIAEDIVKIARKLNSKIPILWGGLYPTLNPEKTLNKHDVDYVFVGEALEAFPDFLDAVEKGLDTTNIKNIWTKKEGKIIKNSLRPLKKDLDSLPYFDWDIFDKRHFHKPFEGKIYVGGDHMSNWGCPRHCTYCINHFYHELFKNKYPIRRYSTKRIINELEYLKKKYGLQFLKFQDEDFLMRPVENLREFSEEYVKRVNLPFVIMTNSKSVTEEKVKILKDMNCVSVSIGIETGNEYLRKNVLERMDSREDIINAFKIFKKFGIRAASFNMLGIPFETMETYMETVELNRESDIQCPNLGFFYPFEGTKLREVSIENGFFDPNKRDVYHRDKPALKFKNLTERDLVWMWRVFSLYVKLPKIYWDFIGRTKLQDEKGKNILAKLFEIYDNTIFANDFWFKDDGKQEEYLKELKSIK